MDYLVSFAYCIFRWKFALSWSLSLRFNAEYICIMQLRFWLYNLAFYRSFITYES